MSFKFIHISLWWYWLYIKKVWSKNVTSENHVSSGHYTSMVKPLLLKRTANFRRNIPMKMTHRLHCAFAICCLSIRQFIYRVKVKVCCTCAFNIHSINKWFSYHNIWKHWPLYQKYRWKYYCESVVSFPDRELEAKSVCDVLSVLLHWGSSTNYQEATY